MSIYQRVLNVLEDHAACSYVQLDKSSYCGEPNVINLKSDDMIQIGLKPQGRFCMSSVASYAIKNGHCPIASYERESLLGYNTHWISSLGSILTNQKQKKVQIIIVENGELIRFEGRYFTVHPDANNNMCLLPHIE